MYLLHQGSCSFQCKRVKPYLQKYQTTQFPNHTICEREKKKPKALIWFWTDRFLENKASAAHELFSELLSTLVGDVISGNDEPLTWRHVIADLVDFAVDYPPLGLLLRLPHSQGGRLVPLTAPGRAGLGPDPPDLVDGGLEAWRWVLESFCEGEHLGSTVRGFGAEYC